LHTTSRHLKLPVSKNNAREMEVRACAERVEFCKGSFDTHKKPCLNWKENTLVCVSDRAGSHSYTHQAARPGFPLNGGTNPTQCPAHRNSCAAGVLQTLPSYCSSGGVRQACPSPNESGYYSYSAPSTGYSPSTSS
jgi:hypothetical protein